MANVARAQVNINYPGGEINNYVCAHIYAYFPRWHTIIYCAQVQEVSWVYEATIIITPWVWEKV